MDWLKAHSLTDLTDHDAFFDLFYDEDLRFEFMSLFRTFTKCLNVVFPAKEALDSLLHADTLNAGRQVAMVDALGGVAAYTGKSCIPDAGDVQGDNFSCQANLMANPTVWPAMKEAFEKAEGDLAERMMQALEAAEKAGGDIRGKQFCSAAHRKSQA
jgi:uncharacterized Ntn-hydrolase superfamily protein